MAQTSSSASALRTVSDTLQQQQQVQLGYRPSPAEIINSAQAQLQSMLLNDDIQSSPRAETSNNHEHRRVNGHPNSGTTRRDGKIAVASNGQNKGVKQVEPDEDEEEDDDDDDEQEEAPLGFVRALYPYRGEDESHINFNKDDLLVVFSKEPSGWWDGVLITGQLASLAQRGWFPSNYVVAVDGATGQAAHREFIRAAEEERSYLEQQRQSSSSQSATVQNEKASAASSLAGENDLNSLGNAFDIDHLLRGGGAGSSTLPGIVGDDAGQEDMTSFSMGGDIFAEITAAAAESSGRKSFLEAVQHDAGDEGEQQHSFATGASASGRRTDQQDNGRNTSGARTLKGKQRSGPIAEIDADWVPKVSSDGRIFYYNVRTGDSALDLPSPRLRQSTASTTRQQRSGSASTGGARSDSGGSRADASRDRSSAGESGSDGQGKRLQSLDPFASGSSHVSSESLLGISQGDRNSSERDRFPNSRNGSSYSVDSVLDTVFAGGQHRPSLDTSATPRKVSIARYPQSASLEDDSTLSGRTKSEAGSKPSETPLLALERTIKPPRPVTLAELEQQCEDALSLLQAVVVRREEEGGHKESADLAMGSSDALEERELAERKQLEEAAEGVNRTTRNLLAATELIIEQPRSKRNSTSSSSSARASSRSSINLASDSDKEEEGAYFALPTVSNHELRPHAMKVTATVSKLMLSVRTSWALLGPSPLEESRAELARRADASSDAETAAMRSARQSVLAARRENEARLRGDLLAQIRSLREAVASLLERIEDHAQRNGVHVSREYLLAPQRLAGELSCFPSELLLPVSWTSGSLCGHGYGQKVGRVLPSPGPRSRPSSFAQLSSLKNSIASASRSPHVGRPLDSDVLEEIRAARQTLLDELASIKIIFSTLLGNRKSDTSLRPSVVPTFTARTVHLLEHLSRFLAAVEDIDLISVIDIYLTPQTYAALTRDSTATVAAAALPFDRLMREDGDNAGSAAAYRTSTLTGLALTDTLFRQKMAAYSIPGELLAMTQALTMRRPEAGGSEQDSNYLAQPPTMCALGNFREPDAMPDVDVGSVTGLLERVDTTTVELLKTLESLLVLSQEQSKYSAEERAVNAALRARLQELRAVARTASSEASSSQIFLKPTKHRSGGGLGLEDEVSEELDATSLAPSQLQAAAKRRSAGDRSSIASTSLQRTGSAQSTALKHAFTTRASRSNSLADSFVSDLSGPASSGRRDPAEDLRNAIAEAGIPSPTSHSPSKTKLKQFFGTDAPGQPLHRPPTATRDAAPSFMQTDFPYDQISYASDGAVRAGTLHALVCRLTNHMSADTSYNNAFLMTYRTFTTSDELLELLKDRWFLEPPVDIKAEEYRLWQEQKQKLVRLRVVNILRSWLTDFLFEDDESSLLNKIAAFAATLPPDASQQLARIIERRKMTGASRRLTASVSGGASPPPILPRNLKKIKFLELDPLEIARQLSIIDGKLFSKITTEECLAKAWPKKFNKDMPNFTAITDHSNLVTGWVAMSIVTQPDVRRRAAVIKQFIAIADKCRQLSNFTTLMQIVAALRSSAIDRLRRTWDLVNQRSISTLTFLVNLMSPDNNYALYRDALRLVGAPCVPFLGVYFTDWVMSGEANSDMLRDKPDQINFAKRARVAESIQQIQLFQSVPYNLTPVPALARWIEEEVFTAKMIAQEGPLPPFAASSGSLVSPTSSGSNAAAAAGSFVDSASAGLVVDTMQKAYDISIRIEPKEREDERIARLLSESGFL